MCPHETYGHELGSKSDKYFLHANTLVIDFVTWKT